MKYFTSYYANFRNIPTTYICVGISAYCPQGFLDDDNMPLFSNFRYFPDSFIAPSIDLLSDIKNSLISEETYKKRYVTELFEKFSKLPYKDLPDWLEALSEEFSDYEAIVFLCYESPEKFCHRHIFSKILNNIYHIPCTELTTINKTHKTVTKQKETYSLF